MTRTKKFILLGVVLLIALGCQAKGNLPAAFTITFVLESVPQSPATVVYDVTKVITDANGDTKTIHGTDVVTGQPFPITEHYASTPTSRTMRFPVGEIVTVTMRATGLPRGTASSCKILMNHVTIPGTGSVSSRGSVTCFWTGSGPA